MIRFFAHIAFFFAPLLPVSAGIVMIMMSSVFGPLDAANVPSLDRSTLVRVMQLRNFRMLPPETASELTDRCEKEFGRLSVQKPVFQFTGSEKKIYAHFRKNKLPNKSVFEDNLMLMARIRYFQWMTRYETGTPESKMVLMKEIVKDMEYWEELYMDFIRAAELPMPTLAELIQEFDQMIESFKTGATPEEIACIGSFKQEINRAVAASKVQNAVQKVSDSISNTFSEAVNPFLPGKKKK